MSNFPSKIKKYIIAANKGKFEAAYQLFKIFDEGVGVEANAELAKQYKKRCSILLQQYDFKIDFIHLENFKSFASFKLQLNDNVTVFVGNNGSGKSTILEAIEKSLTNLSSRISTHSHNGSSIENFEVMVGQKDPAEINLGFSLNNVPFNMGLKGYLELSLAKDRSNFKEINELSVLFKSMNDVNRSFNFPIMASYNVERSKEVTTKDIDKSEEILDSHIWNQAKAYSKSLNGKSDFKLFFRWFKELVEAHNDDSAGLNKLKERLKAKLEELDNPLLKKLIQASKNTKDVAELIEAQKAEVSKLKEQINNYSSIQDRTLDVVCNAIYKFIPEFSNLKIKRKPLDMLITKSGKEFSVLQLSQGEKSLLALIADIARRLVLLNPSLENPLEGTGIILIDEIDLHLHPSWQQKIVDGLRTSFPNIQFIISTHSPLVCHTLESKMVFLIKNGKPYRAPKGLRGSLSSWALENLFEVSSRAPDDKYTLMLERYTELVYANQYGTDEALNTRKNLGKHFGNDYDLLVKLDLYVENKEWEKEFEEGE